MLLYLFFIISLAHLILVHDPALVLLVPALVAAFVFDNLVDGKVSEAGALGQHLAVRGLAYAGRTRHDDVRVGAHFSPFFSFPFPFPFPCLSASLCAWEINSVF